MVAVLHSNVLDKGLEYAKTYADKIYICKTQPTTFAEAITVPGTGNNGALGVKNLGTGLVFPDAIVEVGGVGRKILTAPVTGGEVLVDGTAAYWAVVYSLGEMLLATNKMSSALAVQVGQTWSLAAFGIQLDYPTT